MANFLAKFTFKEARIKLVTITTFKSKTMNYKKNKRIHQLLDLGFDTN